MECQTKCLAVDWGHVTTLVHMLVVSGTECEKEKPTSSSCHKNGVLERNLPLEQLSWLVTTVKEVVGGVSPHSDFISSPVLEGKGNFTNECRENLLDFSLPQTFQN